MYHLEKDNLPYNSSLKMYPNDTKDTSDTNPTLLQTPLNRPIAVRRSSDCKRNALFPSRSPYTRMPAFACACLHQMHIPDLRTRARVAEWRADIARRCFTQPHTRKIPRHSILNKIAAADDNSDANDGDVLEIERHDIECAIFYSRRVALLRLAARR